MGGQLEVQQQPREIDLHGERHHRGADGAQTGISVVDKHVLEWGREDFTFWRQGQSLGSFFAQSLMCWDTVFIGKGFQCAERSVQGLEKLVTRQVNVPFQNCHHDDQK